MRILNIAIDAFFDDTRDLVAEGVKTDIKLRLANSSQDDHARVAARAKSREESLKSWSKQKYPLAYGVEDGHEIL